jgi:Txe/YoeB family toxin of Txe-Axe toxin-antitoxin module
MPIKFRPEVGASQTAKKRWFPVLLQRERPKRGRWFLNRLEALKGDRAGRFSIRINEQWRVCFTWEAGEVFDVEIVDYH